MNELALFAGAGGGILGGKLLGWRTVCAVEWDAYAASVLVARQNDKSLPPFPVWDEIQTFDGRPWRGTVDIVSGGFPCQDISAAGKGAGIEGERSGMWTHMARIVGEVRPRFVFVENSPLLVGRGLARVLGDLAQMGYDAEWGIVGAHHVAAPHKRDRIWVVAHANSIRGEQDRKPPQLRSNRIKQSPQNCGLSQATQNVKGHQGGEGEAVVNPDLPQCKGGKLPSGGHQINAESHARGGVTWWKTDPADETKPELGRVAHGVANRVGQT